MNNSVFDPIRQVAPGLTRDSLDNPETDLEGSTGPNGPVRLTSENSLVTLPQAENELLAAALSYRSQKLSVIPLRPKEKVPLVRWEQFQVELASEEQILRWWRTCPDANIATVTGAVSGLVVVDLDSVEAKTAIMELLPDYDLSVVPCSQTGNGYHLFFKHPGIKIKNRAGVIPGLDIRADGGYACLPPSVHPNGNKYHWRVPLDAGLAELPAALLTLITSAPDDTQANSEDRSNVKIREGERNAALFSVASGMRGKGFEFEPIIEALLKYNNSHCKPPLDEEEVRKIATSVLRYEPNNQQRGAAENPWHKAKPASIFLAQQEEQFKGIVTDLLARGAITLISAPRGLGKTHVAHALAVALATGGHFRGERMNSTRVLLLDRDNPPSVIKTRLDRWGAQQTENLHVLTRKDVPALRDRPLWEKFPAEQYNVVIIDSLGSFTEGVTEREGKATTEVLATILDLARKNIAVLLLHNTTKDASSMRGRGEVADRVDILYEVRDATGFVPSGKKSWWEELPDAGEKTYASRATRRKGRTDYRLAFIPSKFRLGQEPEPFCLQINLPSDIPWTLTDVSRELVDSGDEAREKATKEKEQQLERAAASLKQEIVSRRDSGKLLLKSEAEELLMNRGIISQGDARRLIAEKTELLWVQKKQPGGQGKGSPIALLLCDDDTYNINHKETE